MIIKNTFYMCVKSLVRNLITVKAAPENQNSETLLTQDNQTRS